MPTITNAGRVTARKANYGELLRLMQRLNHLLSEAIANMQSGRDSELAADPYRSLHVGDREVWELLVEEPGSPAFNLLERPERSSREYIEPGSRLAWIWQTFGLSGFDLDVLAIAIAPELDLRYERLYSYLQDDITRKRPTLDFVLNLLSSDGTTKLEQRNHFASHAPLLKHGLIQLCADPHQVQPSFLNYYLKLDEQVSRFLLGHSGLDERLAHCCELIQPQENLESLFITQETKQGLHELISLGTNYQPVLYFQGISGMGQQAVAEALAAEINCSLLFVNLAYILEPKTSFQQRLQILRREAAFQNALLYLSDIEAIGDREQTLLCSELLTNLPPVTPLIILTGKQAWVSSCQTGLEVITVPFTSADFPLRQVYWQAKLTAAKIPLEQEDIAILADRFRLTFDQIERTIATSRSQTRWRSAIHGKLRSDVADLEAEEENFSWQEIPNQASESKSDRFQPTLSDLFAAARTQAGQELTTLARKVKPKFTWDDLVLPSYQQEQLRAICNQVKYRRLVYDEWGFEGKLSLGRGLSALFSGPPGTGKTMAAEAIAQELQLELYKIDLSQVVSKYIGETEKNLDRIFTAAENANAILLFDEADAIFGKRSEVKDAHDRYANLEVAYLLQKMEEFQGISLLTSNLRQNMDDAFIRRIRFAIEFPFPEEEARQRIWQGIFPQPMPLAADVDLSLLAKQFKLTGGSIRNIALAAAFIAAEASQIVSINHLLVATRRELQKMGRMINEAEFLPFQTLEKHSENFNGSKAT